MEDRYRNMRVHVAFRYRDSPKDRETFVSKVQTTGRRHNRILADVFSRSARSCSSARRARRQEIESHNRVVEAMGFAIGLSWAIRAASHSQRAPAQASLLCA